ncbi:type VII secretion protein EsaA [Oceanobacillus halophilus]|uniref:Type VII secretion protein EsaA n=1 Tax=Oceanobacillus halophilus TaxID=930130 RepID=A0A495A2U9_9BACI|nr:type VII secretion protein EsaA [Oceanobacillus halophilus]RKQ33907.1 type VII secretion protein EsaA [Oceanobacillus halophilus]
MNQRKNFPLGIIVKLLIVLALPLLLFRYVDSQPQVSGTSGFSSEENTVTESIAVVNEDNGHEMNNETITLGKEIPMLLNEQIEQGDYNWTVMNRSAAKQGFNNQNYDAIIYIPSNFTENVMTFTQDQPMKASVNYEIQPNLEAKDRENIHRIMANAKNIINQEMSMIYWSYVAQEVDHMKEQFDAILQKEVEFQEAMYAFYAPSSKTLAYEIDQHKSDLENILEQTSQVEGVSADSAHAVDEAEAQLSTFVEALENYKETQQEQQQLLDIFQTENQEAIQAGVDSYQEALAVSTDLVTAQFNSFQPPVYLEQENIQNGLSGITQSYETIYGQIYELKHGSLDENGKPINGFIHWKEQGKDNFRKQLFKLNETLLNVYNTDIYNQAKSDLFNVANEIEESGTEDVMPELPDVPNNEEVDFGEIKSSLHQLDSSVKNMKELVDELVNLLPEKEETPEEKETTVEEDNEEVTEEEESTEVDGEEASQDEESAEADGEEVSQDEESTEVDGEEASQDEESAEAGSKEGLEKDKDESPAEKPEPKPTVPDWTQVLTNLDNLEQKINNLSGEDGVNKTISDWKKYAKELQKAYDDLEEIHLQVSDTMINQIMNKQNEIYGVETIGEEEAKELKGIFLDKEVLKDKDAALLMRYFGKLATLQENLINKGQVDLTFVRELLAQDEVQEELDKLLSIHTPYTDQLQDMFSVLLDDGEDIGEMKLLEQRFNKLVADTQKFMDEYNALVEEEQHKIIDNVNQLLSTTDEITNHLQTVNAENYEWEESPSVEYLDGQMVMDIQQGTAANLDQLSELMTSLQESQSNITSTTEELQEQVNNVQQESDILNDRWSTNVASTGLIRDDIYEILGNTVVDGQENSTVYHHLSSPVNVAGQVNGKVLSETDERVPPVMMFIIILVSGLMIGFLCHYYSNISYVVQGALFLMLNLAVGLIISIYGLNLYSLENAQAIQWSVFTILLLMACSNIVRAGLFIGPFVGWMASIVMIVFFISPLMNIVIPEFSFDNPIANVYMSLQYSGLDAPKYLTMTILIGIVLLVSAFIYALQIMRDKPKVDDHEEKAS